MGNLDERTLEARNAGLKYLSQKHPVISEVVEREGYFIAAINPKNKKKDVFVVVDFTSKQEEHVKDMDGYFNAIYRRFESRRIYRC